MKFIFIDETWNAKYVIEPRSVSRGGYSSRCWLVVKNKETDRYVTEDGSSREYKKFRNSDEIKEYFETHVER